MNRLSVIFLTIVSIGAVPTQAKSPFIPVNKLGPRIINGEKASEGQFPWQTAIFITQPGGSQLCGGALISDSWILTAAHCVLGASKFRIALGSNILTGSDPNRVVVETTDYIKHEDYNQLNLGNDIAVIPLPEAVNLTDNIQPIELASSELDPDTVTTVSGWGLTSSSSSSANNELLFVDLVSISKSDCNDAYGSELNPGVVCAEGKGDVVRSTCEGDSGGPLVVNATGTPVHVGVVSFGHGDGCESGKPAGFTSTYDFRDWIKEKTGV